MKKKEMREMEGVGRFKEGWRMEMREGEEGGKGVRLEKWMMGRGWVVGKVLVRLGICKVGRVVSGG